MAQSRHERPQSAAGRQRSAILLVWHERPQSAAGRQASAILLVAALWQNPVVPFEFEIQAALTLVSV